MDVINTPPIQRVVMILAARDKRGGPAGGIHKAVLAQIAALHTHGIQVHLLTASEGCADSAAEIGAKIDISPHWHHALKPLALPSLLKTLIALRLQGNIRCVIHHSGRTWGWAHVLFAGIPQVLLFHRERVRSHHYFRRFLALSPGYADWLRKHYPMLGLRKVAWAPNGLINTSLSSKAVSTDRSEFKVGFIGRAGLGKGVDTLIEAVSTLVKQGENIQMHFAGDREDIIFDVAERHGMRERVHHVGWLADPTDFIDQIDLLVLPSIRESFGLVLIEAMARSTPVLSTDCNGPAGIITDGETGYLTPIGDAQALAMNILRAKRDPNLKQVGEAGMEKVKTSYLPEPLGLSMIQALNQLGIRIESRQNKHSTL